MFCIFSRLVSGEKVCYAIFRPFGGGDNGKYNVVQGVLRRLTDTYQGNPILLLKKRENKNLNTILHTRAAHQLTTHVKHPPNLQDGCRSHRLHQLVLLRDVRLLRRRAGGERDGTRDLFFIFFLFSSSFFHTFFWSKMETYDA